MLPNKTVDPEKKRQQIALAKCYALLLRLADEAEAKAKTEDSINLGKALSRTDEQAVTEGGN